MEPALPTTLSPSPSALAIWSLVLGILGVVLLVVCIGPLCAIPAIICGHMAYSRIKRSRGALTGEGMALAGLITGYIGVVIGPVWILFMLSIFVPNFVKARETAREVAQKNLCLNNLRRIDGAKQVWALQNNKDTNSTPTMQELMPFFKGATNRIRCPAGGTYSLNRVGLPPTCSIASHDLFNPGATIQEILNDRTNSAR